jgi:hypothetical protein
MPSAAGGITTESWRPATPSATARLRHGNHPEGFAGGVRGCRHDRASLSAMPVLSRRSRRSPATPRWQVPAPRKCGAATTRSPATAATAPVNPLTARARRSAGNLWAPRILSQPLTWCLLSDEGHQVRYPAARRPHVQALSVPMFARTSGWRTGAVSAGRNARVTTMGRAGAGGGRWTWAPCGPIWRPPRRGCRARSMG